MIGGLGQKADLFNQALAQALNDTEDITALVPKEDDTNVMGFLDDVLDLSDGASLMSALSDLSSEDAEGALQALSKLLKAGVVGYEYRKVNGQVQKVFVDVAIGSDLHRAPLARGHERFDHFA